MLKTIGKVITTEKEQLTRWLESIEQTRALNRPEPDTTIIGLDKELIHKTIAM